MPQWIDGALQRALRFEEGRRHADVEEFVHELQHPNPKYLQYRHRPLLQRDSVRSWQIIAGILALTQLASLVVLLR